MDNYKIKNDLKKIERFKEVNESINLIIKKMKYCLFLNEDKNIIQRMDNIIIKSNHYF